MQFSFLCRFLYIYVAMDRTKEIQKVTLVGSAGNVLLTVFKFFAGWVAGSAAMLADAVHSLSDLLTDIIVLVFVHISGKPQDESHDYGHGKFETLATLFIGLALIAAAIGIIVNGSVLLSRALSGELLPVPGKLALWAALVSIAVKEALYQYTIRCGRKLDSKAVIGNAWHHRSDALSSVAAAAGIAFAIILGDKWAVMDPIASIIVGAMLVKVAFDIIKGSIQELTDSSLSNEAEQQINEIICSCPGITDPHNLRTRRIGKQTAIEVHVRMDGNMPLYLAHDKVSEIESKLKEHFGRDTFVTIHMEPIKNSPKNSGR